jgi:hypothetical protein
MTRASYGRPLEIGKRGPGDYMVEGYRVIRQLPYRWGGHSVTEWWVHRGTECVAICTSLGEAKDWIREQLER